MRLIDADAMIAYIKMRIRNEMVIAWPRRIIGESTVDRKEGSDNG